MKDFSIAGVRKDFEWEKDGRVVKTLYERLKMLEDKRKRRGVRYPLAALLVMIIVAKLIGVDEVRAMAE